MYRSDLLLVDFENETNLLHWSEESDNMEFGGISKAYFKLSITPTKQFGYFFSSLKLQPNHDECFCGVHTKTQFNLVGYRCISFKCKAKGNVTTYKVILKDDNLKFPEISFEQNFKVCLQHCFILIFHKRNNQRYICFLFTIFHRLKLV